MAMRMLTPDRANDQAMVAAVSAAPSNPVAELLLPPQQPSRAPHRDSGLVPGNSAATSPAAAPRQPLQQDQHAAVPSSQKQPEQLQRKQPEELQPSRMPPRRMKACWSCGATGVPLKKCSVCAVASYCGAACQKADWGVHKEKCAGLKAAASGGAQGGQPGP